MPIDLFAVQPTDTTNQGPIDLFDPSGQTPAGQGAGFAVERPKQEARDVITPSIDDSGTLPVDSVQPVTTFGEEVEGAFDTIGTLVSGAAAEVGGGLVGLAALPFVGHKQASKIIDVVKEFVTLDAETDVGKRNLQVVGDLVGKGVDLVNFPVSGLIGIGELLAGQGVGQAAKTIKAVQEDGTGTTLGTRVLDVTGSPELATLAHLLPTAALEALGVRGLGATKLADQKLSGNIARAITQAAPDIKTIKDAKKAAYRELDNLGIRVRPSVYEEFANKLSSKLKREGIDPTLHPSATAALGRVVGDIGQAKTMTELDTMRKIAKAAASSINPPDARLGDIIVRDIDDALDTLSQQIGGQFKNARALAQRGFKSQAITDMIENASHTASGLENGLRIEARKILKNKKKRRGFTEDELTALRRIEQGTTASNMAKFLGKFGISEGQATSMLGASIGIGGGGAIGSTFGPAGAAIGALAVPALGQFAKKTAQRITLNNTKFADELVRAGKNAKDVTKAYLKNTPIAERSVSDLTDLLLVTNLRPSDIPTLSRAGKLQADAVYFATEVKRKAQQAGSVGLITQPKIEEINND